MKNLLKERFQKLAGIKSLHEVTIDDKSWPGIEQDFDNRKMTDKGDNTLNLNPETKTVTSMADLFLDVSKKLRDSGPTKIIQYFMKKNDTIKFRFAGSIESGTIQEIKKER